MKMFLDCQFSDSQGTFVLWNLLKPNKLYFYVRSLPAILTAVKERFHALGLSAATHCVLHHVAHVGSHDSLHHLAGAFELLEELVHLRE